MQWNRDSVTTYAAANISYYFFLPCNTLISSTQVTKHCSFQGKNFYLQLAVNFKRFQIFKVSRNTCLVYYIKEPVH